MAWPPSIPMRQEIFESCGVAVERGRSKFKPLRLPRSVLKFRSTSATVSAGANVCPYLRHNRCTRSICSSAYTAGCSPPWSVVTGTYAAQNCAPTAPARSLGMSVMSFGWSTPKSTESRPPRSRIASGISLWPSTSGTVLRMRWAWAR